MFGGGDYSWEDPNVENMCVCVSVFVRFSLCAPNALPEHQLVAFIFVAGGAATIVQSLLPFNMHTFAPTQCAPSQA